MGRGIANAGYPLEVRQYPYGWQIAVFDGHGHVRHLVGAESESQAMRSARKLVRLYGIDGEVLIQTARQRRTLPAAQLREH